LLYLKISRGVDKDSGLQGYADLQIGESLFKYLENGGSKALTRLQIVRTYILFITARGFISSGSGTMTHNTE
jgi:hypothetical protein